MRELRQRAAVLFEQGHTRSEVARQLGLNRSTTTHWYREWEAGELLVRRRRGRPPKLGPHELERVDRALAEPPRHAGFDLDEWSLAAAAALIEKLTGQIYHRRHVGRLLRRMGWLVPPVGGAAPFALRRREIRDQDGNPLSLLHRRADG